MRGRHPAEFFFGFEPHGHWIDPDVFAGQACEKQFPAVLAFEEGAEGIRHLEPPLVIDASRRVAPKHAQLLHFGPLISTEILEDWLVYCQRKIHSARKLRQIFAFSSPYRARALNHPPEAWESTCYHAA